MDDATRQKAWDAAGAAAAALVQDGMQVGLGTGRAAAAGVRALARRVADEGLTVTAVATSLQTEALARELGLTLTSLSRPCEIAFDGADVVTPTGLVIKGAGGALVRERVVDDTAGRFVVLVDEPKVASHPSSWGTLPVAVLPFAADYVAAQVADLAPTRRPEHSDDNLVVLDLRPPQGAAWHPIMTRVRALPGVVDAGLFDVATEDVFVGEPDGTCRTLADLIGEGHTFG